MSWATLFSTNKQQPQNTQQQQQNQQQNNQNNQQQNQNNNDGQNNPSNNNPNPNGGNNQNANPNEPKSALDIYGKMFDNPTNTDKPPAFSIDPKVMDQVVSGQDFMSGADPELVKKATSGDVQALMELMQHSTRNAYRAAIEHGGVLTDKFVGSSLNYSNGKLPDVLKGHLTEQQLAADTPNFKHPVVKKQLTEIARRLQQQNPEASPQEIAQMSKDYLTELMTAITPEDPKKKEQQAAANTDWDMFFD